MQILEDENGKKLRKEGRKKMQRPLAYLKKKQ